jgi:hypothetical protein
MLYPIHNAPTSRARPPAPKRTLHLELRLAISPLRHLRIFPPSSVNPSRNRPHLSLGDIPPLLAQTRPRFVAPDSGYDRRVCRPDIQHILRPPSRVTQTLRCIHRAHRRIGIVLWRKSLFDGARTHLARDLRTREYPPRRKCGEYPLVL